jgi:hypothetical protein
MGYGSLGKNNVVELLTRAAFVDDVQAETFKE